MKIIISESQLKTIVKSDIEEEYPMSWNVEEFKKLNSFNSRVKYCETHLKRISSGSSRIVYMIDNTKVLKLAKNKKGIAQNDVEIGFSNDYMWDGLIAEIFNHDEDGLWVEMELARKVSPKSFQNIVGVSFDNYCDAIRYQDDELNQRKGMRRSKPDNMDEMWENDFVSSIFDLIGGYDLTIGDLCKLSTYGVVSKEGEDSIVMIDYGLTSEVYNSYYG
jgi:hypothetical protein